MSFLRIFGERCHRGARGDAGPCARRPAYPRWTRTRIARVASWRRDAKAPPSPSSMPSLRSPWSRTRISNEVHPPRRSLTSRCSQRTRGFGRLSIDERSIPFDESHVTPITHVNEPLVLVPASLGRVAKCATAPGPIPRSRLHHDELSPLLLTVGANLREIHPIKTRPLMADL